VRRWHLSATSSECRATARAGIASTRLRLTGGSAGGGTMATANLTELLDREGIKYITIQHSRAYTAQEVAAAAHVSGKEMAKTVVTKIDGKPALVVLPAGEKVDFDQIRANTGAHDVELATEQEFATLFPGCELGAMPPFGNLYGLDTYVTRSLADDDEIAFNAGTHTELIRMPYRDFERVVHPKSIDKRADAR
ncbi:MAG TPA: YbaK/EbsC family protein, partial [Gemmatimonadaceae bacterium]|nr:YbaK/EbsC family protein [Gemmatimonadaceae bacterium]